MASDETMVYSVDDLDNYLVTETLTAVKEALDEKGYNGVDQIVGYLMSGDLAYISSYKDSRKKIQKLDREKVIEVLLKTYLKDIK